MAMGGGVKQIVQGLTVAINTEAQEVLQVTLCLMCEGRLLVNNFGLRLR